MRAVELRTLRGQICDVPQDEEPVLRLELEDDERVCSLEFTLYPTSSRAAPGTKKYYWSAVVEKTIDTEVQP